MFDYGGSGTSASIHLAFTPHLYVMRCAIWCHLYNLKNVKNTH